jgi:hypothetical protein
LSSFVSCILLLVSPCKRSEVISQHVWVPFAALSFFSCGIYPDGNYHSVRQRRLPYFPGKKKIQVGLQEMEFQRHVTPPRRGMWKVAPPRFLRRLLIFYFRPKVAARVLKRVPAFSLGSIQFILKRGS